MMYMRPIDELGKLVRGICRIIIGIEYLVMPVDCKHMYVYCCYVFVDRALILCVREEHVRVT